MNIKLSEIITPHFFEVYKDIKKNGHTEYVLEGGRGSTKSTFIAEMVVLLLKRNPQMHALVCRRFKGNLKDSVYNQIEWAVDKLGCSSEFIFKTSPLEIIYKPTKQRIFFRGTDDPAKIKSIKAEFGYIGILWFEELDQFKGSEQIRSIEQSVMRGGNVFYNFKSFNPPISISNWANQYVLESKPSRYVNKSTYLTVPKEWLGQVFFDEAENLKAVNERAYRHEYLGEPVGTGGNVFENVTLRTITDEEVKSFDRIYMGIDWGWFPDPYHWSKVHYDAARRTLYVLDEYRCNKCSNQHTAEYLKGKKGVTSADLITADSAEKKSVADYRSLGLFCRAAEKGPNTVEYSMKWLQSLNEIVIDNARTPATAKEFIEYEYERNRNEEIISGYPDMNNHAIDSIRYALERVWKRKGQ